MTAKEKLAHGTMWFLMWIGFGGCVYLSNRNPPSEPPVQIKLSK